MFSGKSIDEVIIALASQSLSEANFKHEFKQILQRDATVDELRQFFLCLDGEKSKFVEDNSEIGDKDSQNVSKSKFNSLLIRVAKLSIMMSSMNQRLDTVEERMNLKLFHKTEESVIETKSIETDEFTKSRFIEQMCGGEVFLEKLTELNAGLAYLSGKLEELENRIGAKVSHETAEEGTVKTERVENMELTIVEEILKCPDIFFLNLVETLESLAERLEKGFKYFKRKKFKKAKKAKKERNISKGGDSHNTPVGEVEIMFVF